jgi:hypothetical protein
MASSSGTVAERSPSNSKVKGSNPGNGTAAGTGRERKWREKRSKVIFYFL